MKKFTACPSEPLRARNSICAVRRENRLLGHRFQYSFRSSSISYVNNSVILMQMKLQSATLCCISVSDFRPTVLIGLHRAFLGVCQCV